MKKRKNKAKRWVTGLGDEDASAAYPEDSDKWIFKHEKPKGASKGAAGNWRGWKAGETASQSV